MTGTYIQYTKIMLVVALAFPFAAEASNYTATLQTEQAEPGSKSLEKQLLGPYTDINSLTASNLRHAYIVFMENVRSRQGKWSDQEWAQAKAIKEKLDIRRNSMDRILGVADKSQIKVLQAEFGALETKGDIKD